MYRATIIRPDGEHVDIGLYNTREEAAQAAEAVREPSEAVIVVEANHRDRDRTTRHNAPALWDLLNPGR